jgi:hypothetical protein
MNTIRRLQIATLGPILLLVGLAVYVYDSQRAVQRAYANRFDSRQLANELRQSSDELTRLAEYDGFGVDVQVLSTVPVMFGYWAPPAHALEVSQRLNDHIAQAVSLVPERLIALRLHPRHLARHRKHLNGRCPAHAPELAVSNGSDAGDAL